ncbi:MAG: helix-turn-helix transcriptional regulator [Verrucomicrobia bacterium]|nr:helix-turn-helix transcriptional regulator [Verrucomicrobiota bacterium]
MVTAADLQTLNDATLALYAPELRLSGYPQAAFTFLSSLIGVEQINYANLDPKAGSMDMATSFMTPDWAKGVEGFGRHMAKYEMSNFDPAVNGGKPFFFSDFLTQRQFRDLDLYTESFRILGMDHHGAVHVPTHDGKCLWFGLERAGPREYSERDRLMLTLAQPHLANALKLATVRQKMRDELQITPETFATVHSPREAEIAYWLTEGKSNIEISLLMNLHLQTIKGHVTSLFNKTGCGNRLALTLHLIELARKLSESGPEIHVVAAQHTPQVG